MPRTLSTPRIPRTPSTHTHIHTHTHTHRGLQHEAHCNQTQAAATLEQQSHQPLSSLPSPFPPWPADMQLTPKESQPGRGYQHTGHRGTGGVSATKRSHATDAWECDQTHSCMWEWVCVWVWVSAVDSCRIIQNIHSAVARAKLEMFNMKRSYQADSRTRRSRGEGAATCTGAKLWQTSDEEKCRNQKWWERGICLKWRKEAGAAWWFNISSLIYAGFQRCQWGI